MLAKRHAIKKMLIHHYIDVCFLVNTCYNLIFKFSENKNKRQKIKDKKNK
jgi:hypothetical protein